MRFVARLFIAIATLLSSAWFCWGQSPNGRSPSDFGTSPISPPSLSPPESTEGAWVADDNQGGMPQQLPGGVPGGEPNSGSWASDGNAGSDGECDPLDGVDDSLFGPGHHPFVPFTDLWGEVHNHRRTWFQVDYLNIWAKGNPLPPLVTTSVPGTVQPEAGVLGPGGVATPVTSILFGNERVDVTKRDGGRINFGWWIVDGEFLGIEGGYFATKQANTTFNATSSPSTDPNAPILARPFFNVDPNNPPPREDSFLLAFPDFLLQNSRGPLDGTIAIRTSSNIQAANATFRRLIWIDFTRQRRLDLLLGYRFFRVDDNIVIDDTTQFTPQSGFLPPIFTSSQDYFSAKNIFNGAEIGLKGQSYHGRFSFEGIARVAFGNNHQNMTISGFNTFTPQGGPTTTTPGGLLTQPTNIGTYRRDVFAILPEADLTLRYDLTPNLRTTIGYTFMYINRVQRSGNAIDRTVNASQIGGGTLVGDAAPVFAFNDTSFWLHGITGGVEYRW